MRDRYVVLVRQEDGDWLCDGGESLMTHRQAEKCASFARIIGGFTTRTVKTSQHSCKRCTQIPSPAAINTQDATAVDAARKD